MPFAFLIPAAASLIGAGMSASATRSAARTAGESADRATELQRQMFERQVELQEPWRQAGVNALAKLQTASEYTPFGMQQFQADPGYGFRMSEGMKALERSAAARGGLLSGAAMKGIQRYGQDLGAQEYQNAFNRYQAERQARLGPLQSLAGVGQTATQALGSAAGQYGSNVGNIAMQQGQIGANAALARGSAYQRGLSDIGYMAGRYYGQPGTTNYLAPVETRDIYTPNTAEPGYEFYSDSRLKTNVRKLDTRADELGVYEFNYVWGGPKHIGLMAQEVQAVYPDAVVERDGYLMVDYRKV